MTFRKLLKEPFFHFVLIGLFVFLLNGLFNSDESSKSTIIITKDDVARISKMYEQNWNQPPDSETLEKLIEDYINSEIFYQEALKLNLDHNDEIVKRRLRQKYEFVAQDLADVIDPDQEDLLLFYNNNKESFKNTGKLSFSHFYINPDIHKDAEEEADVLMKRVSDKSLQDINKLGDRSHIDSHQKNKDESEIKRIFGSAFNEVIKKLETTGWHGPIKSGYGYHVIYLEEINPATILPFEAVVEDVKTKWKNENRSEFSDRLIKALKANYKIVRSDQ